MQTSRWNKVFIPYCTGDVYAGSITNTYEDPDGMEDPATFAPDKLDCNQWADAAAAAGMATSASPR